MPSLPPVVVVGAGRMGGAIGRALRAQGVSCRFAVRRRRKGVPGATGLITDPATFRGARWIVIATGDQAIEAAARQLAALEVVGPGMVVWHLSGALGSDILAPLRPTGAALGSFHPLQSIADRTGGSSLAGAWVGIEGDPGSLRAARRLARALGMTPVLIPSRAKAGYHAAAAMVPLAIVVVAEAVRRIAEERGIDRRAAGRMYQPLFRGVLDNLATMSPAKALTGPVRRGDAATVAKHLSALRGRPRALYRFLSREAIEIARGSVDPRLLRSIQRMLGR